MIKIGIIGTGGIAGAHAGAFNKIPGAKLVACCDVDPARTASFIERFGKMAPYASYQEFLADPQVQAVSNCTPDGMHAEVAIAAAKAGKHILSEKPLSDNLADGKKMVKAVEKAGVINMVNFSYRRSSGLQKAAALVRKGAIGRIMHVEASYLQSWLSQDAWGDWRTKSAWLWRLSTAHGSLGVLGDVGCHIMDMTTFLAGEDITDLYCRLKTFDKAKGNRIGEYKLDANDSFAANFGLSGGGIGVIHSTRWASGQTNSLRVRLYGELGGIEVDLDTSYDQYKICKGKTALRKAEWKTVKCAKTPDNYQRFVKAVKTGKPDPSDFANALKIQAYLHYAIESARQNKPVKVKI